MGNDIEMSTKKINAGDTLTVGDLNDDYIGASIEVGTLVDVTYKFAFGGAVGYSPSSTSLWTPKVRVGSFYNNTPVTIITPPPAKQPDEPTRFGQCIRFDGDLEPWGVVADPRSTFPIVDREGAWRPWAAALKDAGDRQVIVSGPPRWPDETPEVPDRIEDGEWPDDDTHLRDYKWIDCEGATWRWYGSGVDGHKAGWAWFRRYRRHPRPFDGPWTRGERIK